MFCLEIQQNRKNALLYIAEPRYDNLKSSPYLLNFNKQQLDMKRKIEILKYSKNSSTKKQNFANLIKNNKRAVYCPNLPTLSSSCDIPGPIIKLQNDPDVPLYMYNFNSEAVYSKYEKIE
jgi:hypothetical protein